MEHQPQVALQLAGRGRSGDYEDLVKAFVAPERILGCHFDFIVFSDVDGELTSSCFAHTRCGARIG